MSERRKDQPTRLSTGDAPGTPAERWLRRAFSDASELTGRDLERVPARAQGHAPRFVSLFAHRRAIQMALTIGVVLLAGATFAAFQRFVRPRLGARPVAASVPVERARRATARVPVARPVSIAEAADAPAVDEPTAITRPRRVVERAAPLAPATVAPAIAAPPATVIAAPPAALPMARPLWPAEDTKPVPRSPEAQAEQDEQNPSEAHVLARAIPHLRGGHDAAAALDDLADYDRRFPSGLLEPEALRIRTEALLDVGRDHEALARLDDRSADALTRPLRLLRGELRARAGRCEEALRDLGPLADERQTPAALAGRAIYARASCHAQRGDVATARADLERYEARFPDGSFHADATAFLRATAP